MNAPARSVPDGAARAFAWSDVSAAALLTLPFALLCSALLVALPPTADQRLASDPLIQLAPALTHPIALPLLSTVLAAAWCALAPPSPTVLRGAARQAALAIALAAGGLVLLRLALGAQLPAVIPPEESARPGMHLGLAAGLFEEVVFRLLLLPVLVAALGARTPARIAAALLVGLAFAFAHELGPGARSFSSAHFAVRFAAPGALMSLAFLFIGPAFLVTLHCAAHVVLPLLFV